MNSGKRIIWLTLILFALVGTAQLSCSAQTKTYRLFTKALDGTLWSIQIKDKKELTVISNNQDVKNLKAEALPMVNAGTKNAYYVWDKRMKQFLVISFTDGDRLLNVIADTAFREVKQVLGFLGNKRQLAAQKTYIAVEGITPEQAAKMPDITRIKPLDLESLRKAVAAQKKEIDRLFPTTDRMKKYPSLFTNSSQWLNMQCLLRGYKPPQRIEEYDFLTSRVN